MHCHCFSASLLHCFLSAQLADAMTRDVHYTVDEKQRNVLLTEAGYEAAEDILQVTDLYNPREQWASYVINAIKVTQTFTFPWQWKEWF